MEFVFVDDCSTDGSIAMLESLLASSYPGRVEQTKIIRHDRNRGVAASRNTGLDNATGTYIGWADPDDWVDTDMFLQLYDPAVKNDLDIVWCDYYVCSGGQKFLQSMRSAENNVEVIKKLLTGTRHGSLWTCIAKREFYLKHKIRFLEGVNVMEDKYALVQLMTFAKNIKYIPAPLYYYEKDNANSITASWKDLDVPQAAIENLSAIIRFLNDTDFGEKLSVDMKYAELVLKKGLLNSLNLASFRIWKSLFPEANDYVWSCPNMTQRQKILGWCINNEWWTIAKIWINVKNKLMKQR
jgi:glycosyltransferase involved in cell wall biosynthesis